VVVLVVSTVVYGTTRYLKKSKVLRAD